jgi:hypothetical protein
MLAVPIAYRLHDTGAFMSNGPRQTEIDMWQRWSAQRFLRIHSYLI